MTLLDFDDDGTMSPLMDITAWLDVDEGHDWGFTVGIRTPSLQLSAKLSHRLTMWSDALQTWITTSWTASYTSGLTATGTVLFRLELSAATMRTSSPATSIGCGRKPEPYDRAYRTALFGPLERFYAAPTETLFPVLPNLLYFLRSGVLDTALRISLSPFWLYRYIRPIYNIDIEFSAKDLATEAIHELAADNGITLPDIELTELLKAYAVPKTNVHGEEIYVIDADNADVMTVMLRYIVSTVFHPENVPLIKNAVIDEAGLTGDSAAILKAVIDTFADAINTPQGPDRVLGGLYYIFYGTGIGIGEANKFLGTFNENWTKVLEMFSNSESEFLRNIGGALKDILNQYLGGVIDEGGLASGGIAGFFQRIAEFFQRFFNMIRNLFR